MTKNFASLKKDGTQSWGNTSNSSDPLGFAPKSRQFSIGQSYPILRELQFYAENPKGL